MVSFFAVAAIDRVSKDYPSFSAISLLTFFYVFFSAMTLLAVSPASPVVSLLSSLTLMIAARNYFFAGTHLRSTAPFFFHARYLVLMRPVAPRCV